MKLGAELLKIFVLSPPTTTSGPSRETRTAKLCSVIATIESLVSRRPSNTYKNRTTLSRAENSVFPLVFFPPSVHVICAALFNSEDLPKLLVILDVILYQNISLPLCAEAKEYTIIAFGELRLIAPC